MLSPLPLRRILGAGITGKPDIESVSWNVGKRSFIISERRLYELKEMRKRPLQEWKKKCLRIGEIANIVPHLCALRSE